MLTRSAFLLALTLGSSCAARSQRSTPVPPRDLAGPKPERAALQVAGPAPDHSARATVALPDDGEVLTRGCGSTRVPRERHAGGLSVVTPAPFAERMTGARLRTDTRGALTRGARRTWAGRDVPAFVPLQLETRELFLLDEVEGGLLALYRDPYDAGSCQLGRSDNCAFDVRLYACDGALRWQVAPSAQWSRPDHLELQDVRYDGGVLYYNEACQSYSRESGGACSKLVAMDPALDQILWRSAPLRSNGPLLVRGRYLVTGYGFTAEPDYLFVLRRSDGATAFRAPVPTQHQDLAVEGDVLVATLYADDKRLFRMEGFDGDAPRLVPLPASVRASELPPAPRKR